MSIRLAVALFGLTGLALAMLLAPLFWRRRSLASREAYSLAVYRDQLAEVERDLARGVLAAEHAEAARAEIARRILALKPTEAVTGASPLSRAAGLRRRQNSGASSIASASAVSPKSATASPMLTARFSRPPPFPPSPPP